MRKNIIGAFLVLALAFLPGLKAEAGWGKLTVESGAGDELVLKHGLLGHKMEVKDRLGDRFGKSHSILGSKSEELSVLGNGISYHKGLLGFSSASAHTMLGDSLTSHKNLLLRTTNMNVSGINNLFGQYLRSQMSPSALPSQPMAPFQPAGRLPPAEAGNQPGSSEPVLH